MVISGRRFHLLTDAIRVWHRYGEEIEVPEKYFLLFSFFAGDLEQKFELEISPLCNQQKDTIPSIQIGKYQFHTLHVYLTVAQALRETFIHHVPHSDPVVLTIRAADTIRVKKYVLN